MALVGCGWQATMGGHAGGAAAPSWRTDAKSFTQHRTHAPVCPVMPRTRPRTPFRNNARLVLLTTGGALSLLVLVQLLLRKSRDFSPDFLASVLLYGLTVLNISLLLVLLLVLGRNLVRVIMERRRGVLGRALPHAARDRLRADGGRARPPSHGGGQRPHPADGGPLVQRGRGAHPVLARRCSGPPCTTSASIAAASTPGRWPARSRDGACSIRRVRAALRRVVELRARELKIDIVNVFTAEGEVLAVVNPASADAGGDGVRRRSRPGGAGRAGSGGDRAFRGGRAGAGGRPVAQTRQGAVRGAVIVSTFIPVGGHRRAPRGAGALQEVPQGGELQGADQGRLSLAVPLPGPAHPVRRGLALALPRAPHHDPAAPGGGRRRAHRRPASAACAWTSRPATTSSPPSSPPSTACRSGWRAARRRSSTAAPGLTRKNEELEERRRLMETVLETVGTGVVVVDAEGDDHRPQRRRLPPARRRCRPRGPLARRTPCTGPGRDEIVGLVQRLLSGRGARQEREVVVPGARPRPASGRDRGRPARRARLAAGRRPRPRRPHAAHARPEGGGLGRGRAQARARDQEPAHPDPALRPARAQGLPARGPPTSRRCSTECTGAIVHEVEALKNLVDEFAQFARLPAAQPGAGLAARRSSSRRCRSTTGCSRA